MLDSAPAKVSTAKQFYYGWVVVATASTILGVVFGLQYSFGIFFKPLQDAFGWEPFRQVFAEQLTVRLDDYQLVVEKR